MAIEKVLHAIERAITGISLTTAWVLLPLLIANRVFDIVGRQYFRTPSNFIQVIEWRAFLFLVLLSFGYAYLRNAHIRVDILRNRWSPTTQAWVELAGCLLAMAPFCFVIIWYGTEFALQSYDQAERSGLFLGRPLKWLIKGMLPFGTLLLFLAGGVIFTRNVLFLLGRASHPAPPDVGMTE